VVKRMSAKEARDHFAEVLGQVSYGKDTIIVEKQGKPVVVVIDVERYERLMRTYDEPFTVLDRIRSRNRDKDPAQIARTVAEAVAEVRASRRARVQKRA